MSKQRAIFLDRDGVININRVDHVRTWQEFVFEEGSLKALARLGATDFRIFIITNQAAIGRGLVARETVEEIHARMIHEIERVGGRIDRVYYCPHKPEDNCDCRKPSPGMLWRGRDDFELDLAHSFLIGDWIDDVRAAQGAGVTPFLVQTGRGKRAVEEMHARGMNVPAVFENLDDAVTEILQGAYAQNSVRRMEKKET